METAAAAWHLVLLDAGLTEAVRAGRLTGPIVAVCTAEAASLNAFEQGAA
ncbi:hypothetical protein [Streptomyces sp. NBC_00151]|nr:hypothetical protein [Streptomyces sp. NBC_00151]WRZ44599.1 hypothetical protein OG915_45380 [Streptomyces sp. NBC_00151]